MHKIQFLFASLFLSNFTIHHLPVQAQITPDNTLGNESSQINSNVLIKGFNADQVNGGATRGSNLFHSFSEFNIKDGQRVYFANPSGVLNILTRVTGKDASSIFGTLGVDGNANLFLMNPNGILFGKNASLDVQGSFVGTTANGLQFGNQGVFSATNPEAPALLTINPNALVFSQQQSSAVISNQSQAPAGKDPAGIDVFGLRVPDGKSLLLVGGNVTMDGGWAIANGGHIELGGLTEAGSIGIQGNGDKLSLSFPEGVQRGDVSLNNRALVRVSGNGGGSIAANARNLEVLADSEIIAGIDSGLGTTNTQAGDITINTENLIVRDSQIDSVVYGQGIAGNVKIIASDSVELSGEIRDDKPGNAEDILATNPGGILATLDVTGKGKSGNIYLETRRLSVSDGSKVQVATFGEGNAGSLFIRANEIEVFETEKPNFYSTGIFTTVGIDPRTVKLPKGNAGNLTIETGKLTIRNGGEIDVSTQGEGNGGQLSIKASDSIEVTGDSPYTSRISAEVSDRGVENGLGSGVGKGGSITIETPKLSIKDGGEIISSTSGKGDSGNISITANESILLDVGGIYNNVQSRDAVGNAGKIDITTGSLSLINGAEINSFTRGQGDAGDITITAKEAVTLDGFDENYNYSALLSDVLAGGFGNGGNINLTAGSLSITNGGELGVRVRGATDDLPGGQGIGGNIDVKVRDTFTISGRDSGIFGFLGTGAVGRAGNIKVQAGNLLIKDGGLITSSTFGNGNSGDISITASDLLSLSASSYIFSNVQSRDAVGNAGKIDITTGSLSLTNGSQINSFTRGQGDAGDITITAKDTVTLDGFDENYNYSALLSDVLAGGFGNGGNINLTAGSLSITSGGELGVRVRGATDDLPGGQGIGGNIDVKVRDTFTISGRDSGIFGFLGTGAVGRAGNIKVQAGNLLIKDGGLITSSTFGNGNSGDISITASDLLSLSASSYIFSNVQSRDAVGNAGKIDITTGSLSLTNGSQINSFTRGQGNAGDITIQTRDAVNFDGFDSRNYSALFSDVNAGAVGNGGRVRITATSLSLTNGGQLGVGVVGNSDDLPAGEGDGGSININLRDTLTVSGIDSSIRSGSGIGTSGRGGNIKIESGKVEVIEGGFISSTSRGTGNAGILTINSDRIRLDNKAYLNANTRSPNKDPNKEQATINLNTNALILRRNSNITTNATGQNVIGGNINIDAGVIAAFENSDISANSTDFRGGRVSINTEAIFGTQARNFLTPESDITATGADPSLNGTTEINLSDVDPSSGLIELPGGFEDKSDQIDQLCGRNRIPLGSFVVVGKDGSIPSNPVVNPMQGEIDFSPLASLDESNSSNRVNQVPDSVMVQNPAPNRIVEAQAIVRGADGTLYLVAEAPNAIPNSRPAVPACANVRR
jgi:filamentous hemagglutinin family protein